MLLFPTLLCCGTSALRQHKQKCLEDIRTVSSLEKRRLKEDLLALHNSLKGGCSWVRVRLCSQGARDRTRGNGLMLCQGKFKLDTGKKNFHRKGSHTLKQAARAVLESPSLEVFR